jgi:TRAP transporter 4TM/12TM fusion protein
MPTIQLSKSIKTLANIMAVLLAIHAIYVAGWGVYDTVLVYGRTVWLALMVGLLSLAAARDDWVNQSLHLGLAILISVLLFKWSVIMGEQEEFFIYISQLDFVSAWVSFAIIGYVTYRFFGLGMVFVFVAMIVYALLPYTFGGAQLDWASIADRQWFTTDGVFGRPVQVVSSIVLIFIVFGAVLQTSGAGEILLKLAFAATGRFAGGPAHAAIVGSALFGTMSGAAVANVVSTGVFTIPIIKKAGFKPKFAAAVEAAASTGGQVMPPVMGVVAFIMADVTSIPYLQIVLAAILPAIFYYFSLFMVVLIESRKQEVGAVAHQDRAKISMPDWIKSTAFWVPLGVIIAVLITGRTPQNAGFYAMLVATVLSITMFPSFRHPRAWFDALVRAGNTAAQLMIIVACVGVIIGLVNMTGVGLRFADMIRAMSGDSLFVALVLVMLGCLVMGMGVPTVTAYLVLALVMGPVLENLGIPKIAAHMFMLYFGVLSVVTPPVALAAFAAAPIAGAKPMETAFEAVRLGIAGFIIPFAFVFRPDILIINGFTFMGLGVGIIGFILATWLVATALARYDLHSVSWGDAGLRLVAAIIILMPPPTDDVLGFYNIIGFVIGSILFAMRFRNAQKETTVFSEYKGDYK